MFEVTHFKALICKRFLLPAAVWAVVVSLVMPLSYVKNSFAQEPNDPNEYILEVLLLPDWRISEAIFAYELNGKYYLPLEELSNGFEFFSEIDPENKFAQGFASRQENSFTIDGNRNEVVIKGERDTLSEDAILVSDFVATDDLYVQLEVLNDIWPVNLNLELSTLTIFSEAEEELSFMRDRERKDRQKIALSRKEKREQGKELLPRRDNDYQWFGKPVIDYQTNYRYDADTDDLTGTNIFTGLQNIGKVQADFSTNFRLQDGVIQRPDNVRLRFGRRSAGDEYLWIPGLRKLEFGDVSLRQRELIANSSTGRGITISNDNQARESEFDQITIEGVGPPGWEIELYNNDELVDFGEVPENGLYFFEDVVLGYGNNEMKILFFGPQGQVKEELRSYTAGGNMLKPNEFKYSAGFLDSDRDFILLDNDPRTTPRGVVKTLGAAYGVNKSVTVFSNYSEMPNADKDRSYLTVGTSLSTPIGLMEAEAYSETSGGNAFSLDYIAKFLGARLNLTTSLFNDFESEKSGFGTNKKKSEIEAQITRGIKFFTVPIGLRFNMNRTKRETGITTTDIDTTQTLTRSGIRVSHTARTRLLDDRHDRTSGSLTSTVREGPWQFRGGLNYSLYPESDLVSANGEVRYKSKNDFQTALSLSHNFDTSDYRVGTQVGYDFKKFLGTFESAYERGKGWNFVLRTTTSLHPYTDNDRYTFTSSSKRQSSPIKARVFLDGNANGEQDEGEEAIEGVRLKYGGGRSKTKTDGNGDIVAEMPADRLINVSLDASSLEDPYFVPAYDGFSIVPIKGKMIDAVFPVIETGSVEGMAYRKSNNRAVPGLELDLVDTEGKIVSTVETGFDGFYVFEFVPPGEYSVQTSKVHDVDLLDNSAAILIGDLYVYGHDVYINDANIALIEERVIGIEPAVGVEDDGLYGPLEMFGPPMPPREMTGTHGQDGLLGLEQLAAADALIPAVLPRTGVLPSEQAPIEPIAELSSLVELPSAPTVKQVDLKDVRFKFHNGKARLVAEFSEQVEYEVIEGQAAVGQVQILIKNVSLNDELALAGKQSVQSYISEVSQSGRDVLVTISASSALQVKMASALPPLHGGEGARLMVDVQ